MRVLHNLCALLLPYHSLKFGHEPYPLIVQVVEHRLRMLVPQHLVDVADLLPEVLHLLRRLHLWEPVHRRSVGRLLTEGNVRTLYGDTLLETPTPTRIRTRAPQPLFGNARTTPPAAHGVHLTMHCVSSGSTRTRAPGGPPRAPPRTTATLLSTLSTSPGKQGRK